MKYTIKENESTLVKEGNTRTITCASNRFITSIDESKIQLIGNGSSKCEKTVELNDDGTITIKITVGNGTGDINLNFLEDAIKDALENAVESQIQEVTTKRISVDDINISGVTWNNEIATLHADINDGTMHIQYADLKEI